MTEPQPTIGTLFSSDGASDLRSEDVRGAVRAQLSLDAPTVSWPLIRSQVSEKLGAALDTSLADVFVTTWNKYRVLDKYRDRKKFPPEETYFVPLAKHAIKSKHHPYLEVVIGEASLPKLVFDVVLSLKLEGFKLEIKDATILRVHSGALDGQATLSFKGAVLLEKKFDRVALPGALGLGDGIAIA